MRFVGLHFFALGVKISGLKLMTLVTAYMPTSVFSQTEPLAWERPLLRWAGSKRRLVPTLQTIAPAKWNRYVEPFVGSACLFFALRPISAILGDRNEHLINAYDVLRQHPRILARQVHALPMTENEYYRVRAIPFKELTDFDRAVHFVYLNRLCFNGVYRTNRKGEFNVPLGSNTGGIPSEQHFYRCSIALRNAVLNPGDFESTCALASKGDFVYLDPPYSSKTRAGYGEYGYDSFQEIDMPRMMKTLRTLDAKGCYFVLSYCFTEQILRTMRERWNVKKLKVRRHVAGFSEHRANVYEILVTNYEIPSK